MNTSPSGTDRGAVVAGRSLVFRLRPPSARARVEAEAAFAAPRKLYFAGITRYSGLSLVVRLPTREVRRKPSSTVAAQLRSIRVLLLLLLCGCRENVETPAAGKSSGGAAQPLEVEIVVVQPERLESNVPATGTLLPVESVEIVSELSRKLSRVLAREGQAVKKGDLLFELDAADLSAESARLAVQEALARKTAERQKMLVLDRVGTEVDAEVARAKLEELVAARRALAVTLDKTRIRAPMSGVLGLRRVSEGAWVNSATVLISLQDTSSLKIDFRVPERYAAALEKGGSIRIEVEGDARSYEGKISAIEPTVEASSRSLLVRGVLEGREKLVPGAFAKVQIPVVVPDALLVPAIAVQASSEGRRVYLERDGVARSVNVELGLRGVESVHVVSGLAPGDRVIRTNLLRLTDGSAVRVVGERR